MANEQNVMNRPVSGAAVLVLLLIAAALVLGNYHIVSDADSMFVKRPYFGFSDMFASSKVCTSGPWILAKAQHPSLCLALQNAGLIESDQAFQDRIKRENVEEAKQREECTSKCDIDRSDYLSCMAAC